MRVAIYRRRTEINIGNLEEQEALCRKYATRKGYVVVDVLTDDRQSPTMDDFLPAMESLLDLAEEDMFERVLVMDIRLLARSDEEEARIFKRIQGCGVSLSTVHGPTKEWFDRCEAQLPTDPIRI